MERLRAAQQQGGLDVALGKATPQIAEEEENESSEEEAVEAEQSDEEEEERQASEEPDEDFGSEGEDQYQSPSPPLADVEIAFSGSTSSVGSAPPGPLKAAISSSAPTPAVLGVRDENLRRSGRARGAR